MPDLLIVDDERTTRLALQQAFIQRDSYQVDVAASGREALRLFEQKHYDVVLLDLQMPGISGDVILSQADVVAPNSAFIVLTGYASTETAIIAVRSGAFDYLRKPSSLRKIFETVDRAVHQQVQQRRQQRAMRLLQQAAGLFDDRVMMEKTAVVSPIFTVQAEKKLIYYRDICLELTPIEYKLLIALLKYLDKVVTYAQLAQYTHEMKVDEFEAKTLLRTHIHRLRHKLRSPQQDPLQTIRGRGVLLTGSVQYQ